MLNRPTVMTTAAAALTLAACAPAGDRVPTADAAVTPPPVDDSCGAARLGDYYVNQLPTTEVIAGIQRAAGHTRIRTIRPGDAVTMDFREDRLNIEIGDEGRIRLLRCG